MYVCMHVCVYIYIYIYIYIIYMFFDGNIKVEIEIRNVLQALLSFIVVSFQP